MTMRILLPVLLVTACSEGTEPADTNAMDNAQAAATPAASAPAAAKPAAKPLLTLREKGLALVDPASRASQPIAFGMAEAETLRRVSDVLGKPDERGMNDECPGGALGYATWRRQITLYFSEGKFAGWMLEPEAPAGLTTEKGIGMRSSREDLDRAYDLNVDEEGSLGVEFGAGEFYGTLTGPEPEAHVQSLGAGAACIFS
jgi:hypothetical protein